MAGNVKDLLVRILVDDSDVGKFDKSGEKVKSFEAGLATAATVAGAALAAGVGVAGAAAETLRQANNTVTQITGATGAELESLNKSVENVATSTSGSITDAASLVAELRQQLDITGEPLETVAEKIRKLGTRAGQTSPDVNTLAGVFNLFNVEADQMGSTLDRLFKISQLTGLSVSDLLVGVSAHGAAFKELGFSVGEAASAYGVLTKAGFDADQMVNAMQKGIVQLAKSGETGQDAFNRVVGEIQSFIDVGDRASAIDLAGQIFGTKNAVQFVEAVDQGVASLNAIKDAGEGADGAIDDLTGTVLNGKGAWENAQKDITYLVGGLMDQLAPAMQWVSTVIQGATKWLRENGEAVRPVLVVVAGLAGAVVGLYYAYQGLEAIKGIASMFGLLRAATVVSTAATTANTVAVGANNVAWYASPVTWIILGIIAAIALLVAAAIWLWTNWDSVTKWIGEAWTNLMTGFQFIGGEVSRWWQEDFLGGIERGATWLAGKVLEVIGFFTSIPDKIGQAFQWVGDMLYKAAYSIASAIAWLWNNTVGKIDFTIPDWVPLIGGNHIHFPQIVVPALAAGGVVLGPTLALIGEAGPEAVVPLTEGGRYGFGGGSDRPIEVVVKLDGSVIARVVRKHNDRDDF